MHILQIGYSLLENNTSRKKTELIPYGKRKCLDTSRLLEQWWALFKQLLITRQGRGIKLKKQRIINEPFHSHSHCIERKYFWRILTVDLDIGSSVVTTWGGDMKMLFLPHCLTCHRSDIHISLGGDHRWFRGRQILPSLCFAYFPISLHTFLTCWAGGPWWLPSTVCA